MVSYPLSHLTQDDSQVVYGPIQDDEALVLFALNTLHAATDGSRNRRPCRI
jgi:hypothetical protein